MHISLWVSGVVIPVAISAFAAPPDVLMAGNAPKDSEETGDG